LNEEKRFKSLKEASTSSGQKILLLFFFSVVNGQKAKQPLTRTQSREV